RAFAGGNFRPLVVAQKGRVENSRRAACGGYTRQNGEEVVRGVSAVVAAATACFILFFSGAVAPFCICSSARAADYPTRAVTLVVPYPPGGGVDAMARVIAEQLSSALGEQVVVDNRAGGSGLVGTRTFIKSPPDGHTLFLGHTGSIAINPSLYANAGF